MRQLILLGLNCRSDRRPHFSTVSHRYQPCLLTAEPEHASLRAQHGSFVQRLARRIGDELAQRNERSAAERCA
jgi:hypothetical protein